MAGERTRRRLGDLITLKRGYDLPKSQRSAGPVPVVSSGGISGFHTESMVAGPGVVTGRYGTIGHVQYVDGPFWPLNTTLYVQDFKSSNPRFVYFALKNFNFHAFSDKAAVPGVNRNELHNAEVEWPGVEEQAEIASVLGAIEAKRSAARKVRSVVSSLIDAEFNKRFIWPAQKNENLDNGRLGTLGELFHQRSKRVGNMQNVVVLSAVSSGELMPSDQHFDKQVHSKSLNAYKLVEKGDFAYNPSRINIGSIGIHQKNFTGAVSPIYVVCRPDAEYEVFLKYYIRSAYVRDAIGTLASGTVRQSLSYADFASIKCIIPPRSIMVDFTEFVADLEDEMRRLKAEEALLEELEQTLLEPLLTGRLKVSYDPAVEAAA